MGVAERDKPSSRKKRGEKTPAPSAPAEKYLRSRTGKPFAFQAKSFLKDSLYSD